MKIIESKSYTRTLPYLTISNMRSINKKLDLLNSLLFDQKHQVYVFCEKWITAETEPIILAYLDPNYFAVNAMICDHCMNFV